MPAFVLRVPFAAVSFICILVLASGCRNVDSGKAAPSGVQRIPLANDMPHAGVESTSIEKVSREYVIGAEQLPPSVSRAKTFLADATRFSRESLSLFVRMPYGIEQIGDDRILVLDYDRGVLVEYDMQVAEATTIATAGDGPGELNWARDIAVQDSKAYVVRSDQQISIFDCGTQPCTYSDNLTLQQRGYSIAPVDDETIAIHTTVAVPQTTELSVALADGEAVTVIGRDGQRVRGFGETYDVKGNWMLIKEFVASGTLDYSHSRRQFIVSFRRFPYLYVYNADGRLATLYEVDGFTIGRDEYDPGSGMLTNVTERHSVLDVRMVDDRSVVLEVTTSEPQRVDGGALAWNNVVEYYYLRLDTGIADYLGAISRNAGQPLDRLVVLPDRLLVESGGELFSVSP